MRAKRVDNTLNELMIGKFVDSQNKKFFIYKNPISLKHIGPNARAITTLEGDIYIMSTSEILHSSIIDFLIGKNILTKERKEYFSDFWKDVYYTNLVCWHRYENTDDFYLADSYVDGTIPEDDKMPSKHMLDVINKFTEKVPINISDINFVHELIPDY